MWVIINEVWPKLNDDPRTLKNYFPFLAFCLIPLELGERNKQQKLEFGGSNTPWWREVVVPVMQPHRWRTSALTICELTVMSPISSLIYKYVNGPILMTKLPLSSPFLNVTTSQSDRLLSYEKWFLCSLLLNALYFLSL